MDIVTVTSTWSPDADRYTVYTEPPASGFDPDPMDTKALVLLLWEVDEDEQETGRLGGIEIFGFLEIDDTDWAEFAKVPGLWHFPGQEPPVPLDVLLKREQARLREATPARLRR